MIGTQSAPEPERYLFIDSWRGVAASMVALVHFYGIVAPEPTKLAPAPLDWLLRNGDSGVEIFFVLSGVVVTHNVLSSGPITWGFLPRFALRRSIRLDPPYWFIIALNLVAAIVVRSTVFDEVGPGTVLANMTYLDNLLGLKSIVSVGWTLCLEIQFYLLVVVLLLMAQALGRRVPGGLARLTVFLPVWAWSLAVAAGVLPNLHAGVFLTHWYLFFLGVAVAWLIEKRTSVGLVTTAAAAVGALAVAFVQGDASNVFAVVVAVAIVVAALRRRLGAPFGGRPLQYLGRISYSLYLVHPLVGNRALRMLLKRVDLETLGVVSRWMLVVAAFVASVVAAHLLWRLVERPAQRLSRRLVDLKPGGGPVPAAGGAR